MALKDFFKRSQRHNYQRLSNGVVAIDFMAAQGYEIPRYKCKNCGGMLHLEPWQMESLPRSMKYNCVPKPYSPH